MIQAIINYFQKPKISPLFNQGDRIRVLQLTKAKKVYTALECYLDKNMELIFKAEADDCYFFSVRTHFEVLFNDNNFAKDYDTIYITKEVFKTLKYKRE